MTERVKRLGARRPLVNRATEKGHLDTAGSLFPKFHCTGPFSSLYMYYVSHQIRILIGVTKLLEDVSTQWKNEEGNTQF